MLVSSVALYTIVPLKVQLSFSICQLETVCLSKLFAGFQVDRCSCLHVAGAAIVNTVLSCIFNVVVIIFSLDLLEDLSCREVITVQLQSWPKLVRLHCRSQSLLIQYDPLPPISMLG